MTPGPAPTAPTAPTALRHPTVPAHVRPEPLLRRLVGSAFRRRRGAQGRPLADVAGEARISIAYLSEIERGRKEPSSEVLVAVCRALDMRLADLLTEVSTELRAADARAVADARGVADVRQLTSRAERPAVLAEGPAGSSGRRSGDAYLSVA